MAAEADDDLDYHITFPSPVPKDDEEGDLNEVTISPEKQEPVVLLLGWAGCLDKHLSKYISIYERSCITIRYTSPTSDVFLKAGSARQSARKLLELIVELNLAGHPLLIHWFSNGGGMIYMHLSEMMHTVEQFSGIKLVGCIIDSAPSKRSISTASRAIFSILGQYNIIIRYVATYAMVAFLVISRFITFMLGIVSYGMRKQPSAMSYFDKIGDDPAKCPQLYLYSSVDEIVDYEHVEAHIEQRKRLGLDIETCRWDDAAHVQIFRQHPEVYTKTCRDFLAKCMSRE